MRSPTAFLVLVAAASFAPDAHATRIPVLEPTCTLPFGPNEVAGAIATIPGGTFAVITGGFFTPSERVYVLDQDCVVQAQGNLAPLGLTGTNPAGLDFDPVNNRFVLLDQGGDRLVFVAANGTPLGSCDLPSAGVTDPGDIAVRATDGVIGVTDLSGRQLHLIDPSVTGGSCVVQQSNGLTSFSSPGQIVWHAPTGSWLVAQSNRSSFFVDDQGTVLEEAPLPSPVRSNGALSLAFDAERERWRALTGNSELVQYDSRGSITETCDISASSPTLVGVAFDTARNELLILDGDTLRVLDPTTCAALRSVNLRNEGIRDATGLDHAAGPDRWLVTHGRELTFLDPATGQAERTCTVPFITEIASGVAHLPALDHLVVTESSQEDKWGVATWDCEPLHVRTPPTWVADSGFQTTTSPITVAASLGTGEFLMTRNTPPQQQALVAVDLQGRYRRHFTLAGTGAPGDDVSLARVAGTPGRFLLAGDQDDRIYTLDLPQLTEPTSVDGYYASGATSAWLFERGEGRVTGTVFFNGSSIPVFAQLTSTNDLVFGALPPGIPPVVLDVDVSADLQSVRLPTPLGRLTRGY